MGGADLEVVGVRAHLNSDGSNETVRIFRWSDGVELVAAQLVSATRAWVEAEIAEPVTLVSGQEYIVSTYAAGVSRGVNSLPHPTDGVSADIHPRLDYLGGYGGTSAAMPAAGTGFYGFPDFMFTVVGA